MTCRLQGNLSADPKAALLPTVDAERKVIVMPLGD